MAGGLDAVISQAILRYKYPDKTKQEAAATVKHYQSLCPKKEKFFFNDGTEKELLNLSGTIPVRYKGNIYNIPVCIWLLDNYPQSAPMVFVKPTPDMLIKPSKHVDQSGKVYLPYLHEWSASTSDLLSLVQITIMIFAETPPVYSKPKNTAPSPVNFPNTPYPTQPPTGFMPVPGASSLPYPTSGSSGAVPPYPTTGPPGQPPYPMYQSGPSLPYATGPVNTPYPTVGGNLPYPAYPSTNSNFNPLSGGESATVAHGTTTGSATSSGTISEEHIRASLISAANHLVKERLRDVYGTAQAEVSALRQQQADLNKGKAKLEGLMTRLTNEQNELDKCIRHLHEKESELKSVIDKVTDDTEPLDIDEAVTTTAPIYKQLLQAYSEDQATQDAIYYLGEALRRDVIDLDTYLKYVRSLSRRQFQLRATMNKCRAKANLPA